VSFRSRAVNILLYCFFKFLNVVDILTKYEEKFVHYDIFSVIWFVTLDYLMQ